MAFVNRALTALFDAVLSPLGSLPPVASLAIVALVTAAVAMAVVRWTSNQERVRAAKNRMYAALLEMRLFNDDLPAIARATGEVLIANAAYLRASLAPVLWLIVPFALAASQLDAYYGSTGIVAHEPALVTAHLRADAPATPFTLDAPEAIKIETPAVAFPATHEVLWRVSGVQAGTFALRLNAGGEPLEKSVTVGDAMTRRSAERPSSSFLAELESPSEPPIPATSPVERITVDYPSRELTLFRWRTSWLVVYFGFTIVFGLVIGRIFHVEI